MDHFPNFRGENKKYLKPPLPVFYYPSKTASSNFLPKHLQEFLMQQAHFCQAPGNIRHILTGEERAPQCVCFSPHWKSLRKHSRYLGMILLPLTVTNSISTFKQISLQIPQSNKHGSMNLKGFCCHLGSLEVSKPCETIRNLISSHISCSWGAKSQTFPTDSSATASIISGQSMPAVAYPELLCSWRIFFALEGRYQDISRFFGDSCDRYSSGGTTPISWVQSFLLMSQVSTFLICFLIIPVAHLTSKSVRAAVSTRFFPLFCRSQDSPNDGREVLWHQIWNQSHDALNQGL